MTDRRESASGTGEHTVYDADHDLAAVHEHDLAGRDEHDLTVMDEHDPIFDERGYDEHGYDERFEQEPVTPLRRRDIHARPPRRTGRALRRLLVFLVAIGLVGAAAVAAVAVLRPVVAGFGSSGDNDFSGPGTGSVQVTVHPGDTGRAIAETLFTAGVVKSAKAFADAAAGNPASAGIQPGDYRMKKEMKAADAVAFLANPANRTVAMVTVREGLWKSEVFAALSKETGKPVTDYETAAKDATALGLPPSAKGEIEGYLFPATYEFGATTSAAQQLHTMVAKAVATLTALGVAPDAMQQPVVTASILESEAKNTADREKVARVLLNRIAKNIPLQLDSTVSYGVQKRAITTTDAERANKNPYNTYLNTGLPAGPIGNPGQSAMEAALHPADGPWLFFVAVNPSTGETKFATTLAEHDQYVKEFQDWCQANPGKC
ncbi:MAG: endolytic transglycosylase MltG [Actinomycetota bacterium]|nr:endolytic transglycosylase MltG [Actinomycetota bacterium]